MPHPSKSTRGRRGFLHSVGVGSAAVLVGCASQSRSVPRGEANAGGERAEAPPPTPAEDLMREHGVIERILLVFEENVKRIDEGRPVPHEVLHEATRLNRAFTEDYHERLEEEFVFPRITRAGRLTDLVETLRRQHDAGREVTDAILAATRGPVQDARVLRAALRSYVVMYIPHAAREDTVLFPELAKIAPEDELRRLAERFEALEEERFGEHGFESVVQRVAQIEEELGIASLAAYTPSPSAIREMASRPPRRPPT